MKQNQQHIIDKVFVEVKTSDKEKAFEIKDNISVFFENEVFPGIEEIFDELGDEHEISRFEKLEINLLVNRNEIFSELNRKIIEQLRICLESPIENQKFNRLQENKITFENNVAGYENLTVSRSREILFFRFLESGFLPWYALITDLEEFTGEQNWKEQLGNAVFVAKLAEILTGNEAALKRFVYQFPHQIVQEFLFKLSPSPEKEIRNLEKLISVFNAAEQAKLQFLILSYILSESDKAILALTLNRINNTFQGLKKGGKSPATFGKIEKLIYENTGGKGNPLIQKKFTEFESDGWKPEKDSLALRENLKEGILIQNAGLIILHPFIKSFFIETGIVNQTGAIEPENYELAVQALHYLATGHENEWEALLIFEKFLCGIPFGYPLLKTSVLTPEIKKEAEQLLQQVISYWPALKSTSPDGLRQMFLQRRGKLLEINNGYRIIVERKAHDLLLDSLNWNIAIIRLPFSDQLIYTDW